MHKKIKISKPLVLIGMMGVGKTHLGKLLASELDVDFTDTDLVVEERAGCTISEIFERDGEAKFREVEAQTIQSLLGDELRVISTGGGAILNPMTLNALLERSVCIWVNASFEILWARVSKNANRPLLACENPQEVLKALIKERELLYKKAHIHIENDANNINQIMQGLIKQLEEY